MSDPEKLAPEDASRRRFLKATACALGGCVAGGPLAAACASLFAPVRGGAIELEGGGADVGKLEELAHGARKVIVRGRSRDGFFRFGERPLGGVLVVRDGDKVRAFSTICPHAGCEVETAADGKSVVCPCHKSCFALDGSVTSGPSPRGLEEFETRVESGRVRVQFRKHSF